MVMPTAKPLTTYATPAERDMGVATGPHLAISVSGVIALIFHTARMHNTNSSGRPMVLRLLMAFTPKIAVRDMSIPPMAVQMAAGTDRLHKDFNREEMVSPNIPAL